jgi:Ca2+-transporting ATPase
MRLMTDVQLSKVIANYTVFARVTPERKHRILSLLKKHDVTAMTGDGVNDVPALTSAHVGIAMNNGSDIAKDAGDIILLDNNFRSIVTAVHEGRTVYANIKRMVAYLISTNLGEALVSIVSLALGYPIPLVPIQILWVNLVTDTTMVIPLGLEPSRPGIMRRKPIAADAPLFSRFMLSRIILIALMMVWLVTTIYIVYSNASGVDYARTAAFTAMVAIQWATALSMRSDYEPIWKRIFTKNAAFWIGLAGSVTLQLIAVLSPLSSLLHVARISYGDLFFVSGLSFIIPIILIECHKFIGRRFFNKG